MSHSFFPPEAIEINRAEPSLLDGAGTETLIQGSQRECQVVYGALLAALNKGAGTTMAEWDLAVVKAKLS